MKAKQVLEITEDALDDDERLNFYDGEVPYRIDAINLLKRHGAKGESRKHVVYSGDDRTLLEAIDKQDTNAVKALIARGVNVNVHDANAPTALWYACAKKDITLVRMLIHAGAGVNARFGYDGLF